MGATPVDKLRTLDQDAALRAILQGTVTETGEDFFRALVQNLAEAIGTDGAWVTEYLRERNRLRAYAFWLNGRWLDTEYEHHVEGTPCQAVVENRQVIHIPERVVELYPDEPDLKTFGAVSYLGVPLLDTDDTVLGHLAVFDSRPMPEDPRLLAIFNLFVERAGAELRRLRAERALQAREAQLRALVDSAMDAILGLDDRLRITLVNPAFENLFGVVAGAVRGRDFADYLDAASRERLRRLAGELDSRAGSQRSAWLAGGLTGTRADGRPFAAEATLARADGPDGEDGGAGRAYTLILRDVNERLEAERRIQALSDEADYLREELRALGRFEEIIGQSEPLLAALRAAAQVAPMDATVLLTGETGTGKELFARAIHQGSRRHERALVRVNCAAIPAALIESEFFGHERGAFTGATSRRTGRFALADGGTIFLDEIGELPLELQAKLLRVLQEGEFEPVGSSRTQRVNVRVIAATNRDLGAEVAAGRFREDLYYRLNVFPLAIPPLRERGDDVRLLAEAFSARFGERLGRRFQPLTPACVQRLRAYPWPGNVRELANIIERAAITARGERLNLAGALPATGDVAALPAAPEETPRVRTAAEMAALERANLILALEASGGRVAGPGGAAERLALKPSTVYSRLKALGIQRPR